MTTVVQDHTVARRVIDNYLYNARDQHYTKANEECHIKPVRPTSTKEFIDWIKADKYKIDKDADENAPLDFYAEVLEIISFTLEEPDYKKQKEIMKKVDEDYQTLKFHNQIIDPEKMMKEAEDFKKRTYH